MRMLPPQTLELDDPRPADEHAQRQRRTWNRMGEPRNVQLAAKILF
jgi:hypothetical protein